MTIDLQTLQSITWGAVSVMQEPDGFRFHRFTAAQEAYYQRANADFYRKTGATPCVSLRFSTDSRTLTLAGELLSGSSRSFYRFDLLINGLFADSFGNADKLPFPPSAPLPIDKFRHTFHLPAGEKALTLVLPFNLACILQELSVDDGATLTPAPRPEKKLLMFGDSITHGYDSLHPSRSYACRLIDFFGAEGFNKAIGGEIFCPDLAMLRDGFDPDYITVAYGTNDSSCCPREAFEYLCTRFYHELRENYPRAQIFAISPIWRKDFLENRKTEFHHVGRFIQKTAQDIGAVFIEGIDLVPHNDCYFADRYLHPNDDGFAQYYDNLTRKLSLHL